MRRGDGDALTLALLGTVGASCGYSPRRGNAAEAAFMHLGYGTRHSIPTVTVANGRVGPASNFCEWREITRRFPNTEAGSGAGAATPTGSSRALMPDVGATEEPGNAMAHYPESHANYNTSEP